MGPRTHRAAELVAHCHPRGPCVGQGRWQEQGGCGTHGQLRLRAVEVGVEQHGDVAVAGLQRDGHRVVAILRREGERLGRGLGTGRGRVAVLGPPRQRLTLSTMETSQVG